MYFKNCNYKNPALFLIVIQSDLGGAIEEWIYYVLFFFLMFSFIHSFDLLIRFGVRRVHSFVRAKGAGSARGEINVSALCSRAGFL